MSKNSAIPDAWDDDWESQVDESLGAAHDNVDTDTKLTKAERLERHAEANKRIWRTAEETSTFHFLKVHDNVPLKTEFKPALTLLSRKPAPRVIEKLDPITGVAQLLVENEEDEEEPQAQPTPSELKLKAQREREEKQKKYEEARARILGTASVNSTFENGTITKNISTERTSGSRSFGRGKAFGKNAKNDPRPGTSTHKTSEFPNSAQRENRGIIRTPRGPDSSERGGLGFVTRGGKSR